MAGHVARVGEITYTLVVRISKEKNPFGRHRFKREDNIKMDSKDILCGLGSSGSG
jgi:hypothetical protein